MINFINKCIGYLAAFMLALLVILTNTNVFFRHVLDQPITWGEEASGFLLTWIIALGIILAEINNSHLSIPFIVERLPAFWRRISIFLAAIVEIFLVSVFAFLAYQLAMETTKKTNLLEIHSFYFFIPYAFAGVYIAFLIINDVLIKNKKVA